MAEHQVGAIARAIADIYGARNGGGTLCCTLEAVNADGMDVSIQVTADSVNLAPYPHADEPLSRLELSGALEGIDDMPLELIDWDANAFATIGTLGNDPAEIARLIDRIFVKVLACTPTYPFKASIEDLS